MLIPCGPQMTMGHFPHVVVGHLIFFMGCFPTNGPMFTGPCDPTLRQPQSKPGQMKVSEGQSQPQIAAAAFLILYMALCKPFIHTGF